MSKFEGDPMNPEDVAKWRKDNEGKLNPQHDFVEGSGGALMEEKDVDETEIDALKEKKEDL